jgi:hypothetical protein
MSNIPISSVILGRICGSCFGVCCTNVVGLESLICRVLVLFVFLCLWWCVCAAIWLWQYANTFAVFSVHCLS